MDGVAGQWDSILTEFRNLGGVADNIRIGAGPRGRGLFAIDPSQLCRIVVPARLLIKTDDVIAHNRRLTVKPGADVEEPAANFFERYHEAFGFGARSYEDCRRVLEARHHLPDAVQDHLLARSSPSKRFPEPTEEEILTYFINTRSIGENQLMPVLELANHSSEHAGFQMLKDGGLKISGRFADEVLVQYTGRDTWRIFAQYGFACPTPIAHANPGVRQLQRLKLAIGHDYTKVQKIERFSAPVITRSGDTLELSFLELGNRQNPYLPKWIFTRLMQAHNVPGPEELFDVIAHINRCWLYRLLELLENCEGFLISEMRRAARMQLETLSFAIGTSSKPRPLHVQEAAQGKGRVEESKFRPAL